MVAVVFGALAAVSAWGALRGIQRDYAQDAERVPSLMATRLVDAGQRLDKRSLEVRLVPRSLRQKGALSSLAEVEGKVAAAKIFAGDQITLEKVTHPGEVRELSKVLPTGMRAVAIKLRDVAMGLRLKPGDRVDVIGIWNDSADGHELAKTIVADAQVLAVGQLAAKSPGESALALGNSLRLSEGDMILAVSPEEGQRIALVQSIGEITVALRAPGDKTPAPSGPTRLGQPVPDGAGERALGGKTPALGWVDPFGFLSEAAHEEESSAQVAVKPTVSPPTRGRDEAPAPESDGTIPQDYPAFPTSNGPGSSPRTFRVEIYRGSSKSVEEVGGLVPISANTVVGREAWVDGMEQ